MEREKTCVLYFPVISKFFIKADKAIGRNDQLHNEQPMSKD